MIYTSTVIISKEGKWFIARSAELGVVSQGKTIEQAKANLQEAIELYLEDKPTQRRVLTKERPFVTSMDVHYA